MRPILSFGRKILRQWLHDSAGLQEGWISLKKKRGISPPGNGDHHYPCASCMEGLPHIYHRFQSKSSNM